MSHSHMIVSRLPWRYLDETWRLYRPPRLLLNFPISHHHLLYNSLLSFFFLSRWFADTIYYSSTLSIPPSILHLSTRSSIRTLIVALHSAGDASVLDIIYCLTRDYQIPCFETRIWNRINSGNTASKQTKKRCETNMPSPETEKSACLHKSS